jgi:hypothetical protein
MIAETVDRDELGEPLKAVVPDQLRHDVLERQAVQGIVGLVGHRALVRSAMNQPRAHDDAALARFDIFARAPEGALRLQ